MAWQSTFLCDFIVPSSLAVGLSVFFSCSSSVDSKCTDEVSKRVSELKVSKSRKCCFNYLKRNCIKALCHESAKYSASESCVGEHLYKELSQQYQSQCPNLTDSSFQEKCPGLEENQIHNWGNDSLARKKHLYTKPDKASLITYLIGGFVVFLIVLSLVWVLVWWFSFGRHKKTKEAKSTASKRSSGLRERSKSKKSRGSGRSKSKNRKRTASEKGGSFNSRAINTRKLLPSSRKPSGRGKIQYTKFKQALM